MIPVVDLFAGPGGLGEGFASFKHGAGPPFEIVCSIEKEPHAHRTLLLRTFYRQFGGDVPSAYYRYLQKQIDRTDLFTSCPSETEQAKSRALQLNISGANRNKVAEIVDKAINHAENWVLLGGPPCQAYSIVGRSRMLGEDRRKKTNKHSADHRHRLYEEYLHIIGSHWPSIFIMENVPGILSAKHRGEDIFQRIITDLSNPRSALGLNTNIGHSYQILPLVDEKPLKLELAGSDRSPDEFIVDGSRFGLPQRRRRVILLGVRSDVADASFIPLRPANELQIESVLQDMPPVRSGLSKMEDSETNWKKTIASGDFPSWFNTLRDSHSSGRVRERIESALEEIKEVSLDRGGEFVPGAPKPIVELSDIFDPRLCGFCNHESRGHMSEDLHRYLFASCFADVNHRSPVLKDFPIALLPNHRNAGEATVSGKFADRFRVQVKGRASTTITSHISKDGHYYIHYDPSQCRSLTVREAARLQTFPDNYLFEGPRTAQYVQVGNAVPPFLAKKIAGVVFEIMDKNQFV